jgi:polyhydroxyalkanoate synthase subunit PhaC
MSANSPIPLEYWNCLVQATKELSAQLGRANQAGTTEQGLAAELGRRQNAYFQQLAGLWFNTLARCSGQERPIVIAPEKGDRRFHDAEWRENPFYDFLKQSYLLQTRFINDLIDAAGVDEKTRARLRFFARQYLDALSPTNFPLTNPAVLKRAVETEGQSFAKGWQNLAADVAKGRISQTNENYFEVGRNLATSPGAVIYENDLMQVIQYAPATPTVHQRPLLMVPPCINKFYILDLSPENSFVSYAVAQGHSVFMISWRNITPELGHLRWDDYLELGVLQAIDVALDATAAGSVNALGFCVGGTILGCAATILRARGDDKIASLTLLTTMLDFADTGEIGLLIDEASVAQRDSQIGAGGVMSGAELAFVFSALRSKELIWSYVVGNYLKGETPEAFDLLYWNGDSTNLPGPMYCWYVRNTYLENKLRQAGATVQCGIAVDFSRIDMPVYILATREDHIVPWKTAYNSADLVTGATRFVLGASGHIAGVVNPASRNKRCFWVEGELGKGPDHWLETACSVPGSWWSDWSQWLAGHAGPSVAASAHPGGNCFRPIEPAPGRYVKERMSVGAIGEDRLTRVSPREVGNE